MRRILVIFVLLVGSINAQNFHNDVKYFDDTIHTSLQFGAFGYYGSTVMDNYTSQLFFKGGYFNSSLKNESLNRLSGINYFGGEYGFQMTYSDPLTKIYKDKGFYVNYETKGAAGITFKDDLFKVVFEGNSSFVGDTANMGPMELSSFQYKKIGFGLNEDDRVKIGIGLLSFDSWQKSKIEKANLYTQENLDSVYLDLQGDFRNAPGTGQPVGIGVALDFEVIMPLKGLKDTIDNTKLVAGVKNLGVFISNKQMVSYYVDTNYSFSGFNIASISDFQTSLVPATDVQDSLVPKEEVDRIFDLLPFELYFFAPSRADGKKLQFVYGFRYRYGVGAMPQVYAGADWRPTHKFIFSNYIHLGGYAKVQWGMSFNKCIGDFKLGLSSNNLHGFFTKEAYSQSIGLTMSYAIK